MCDIERDKFQFRQVVLVRTSMYSDADLHKFAAWSMVDHCVIFSKISEIRESKWTENRSIKTFCEQKMNTDDNLSIWILRLANFQILEILGILKYIKSIR